MTTSPGHTVSRARVSPLFSAVKYCPTGSAWPEARFCLRASSTALAKSGNHGIPTSRPGGPFSLTVLPPSVLLAPYSSPAAGQRMRRPSASPAHGEVEGDQGGFQVGHGLDLALADLRADQLGGGAGQPVIGLAGNGGPVRMVAAGPGVPGLVQLRELVQRGLDPLDGAGPGRGDFPPQKGGGGGGGGAGAA